ncbi:restriction endonuclease subunit S [Escherichia coli]|uniref:restriction endonuclease subunit S n=1 Tax=Escherichia coli TaxID=562 RepID=UPI000BD28E0F|nr:type I restriction endonuclease subunit S [Escherichia coli]RIJ75933.1 restriction endonuclease subunit S [Escherichia coli]RIX59162.1 restriction endonuclease subunit S [Escherichia coli]
MKIENLITDHLDLWTAAVRPKSSAGRGSNSKLELTGIKNLRELILELAVRGKLVPQDPSDEPASVLLERIAAEKTRLVKEGKIKKPKALPEISEEEKRFELPEGWEWGCLGDIVAIIRGITFPASEKHREPSEERIACLRTANVQDKIEWDDLLYVKTSFVKRLEQRAEVGDIVMSMANSKELVGKVAYIEKIPSGSATFGGFLSVIRPYEIDASFLMTVLRAPQTRSVLIDSSSQTTNIANISLEKLNPLVIAIPPLPEQHRIVAKVDELMALCDQLELRSESQLAAHQTLVETLLATLTDCADADELAQNWARLSTHFDTLFTTEASIDALKQTILQLAVMGKLVPQDPSDEPASALLDRIAAEKAQLVKEGKIKKQKPQSVLTEEEKAFELPNGWKWVRLQQLVTLLGDGLHGTPSYDENGDYFFVNGNNLDNGRITIKPDTKRVNKLEFEKYKKNLTDRTILVSINGSLGKVGFYAGEKIVLGKSACYFNLSGLLSKVYFKRVIESSYFTDYAFSKATGSTIKNLGLKAMNEFPIALPPIEEMKRIISRIEQLIALCDQLKVRLQTSQQTQLALAESLVEGALA